MHISTLQTVRRRVKKAIRESEQAAKDYASRGKQNNYLVDYHLGCIGLGMCLVEEIDGMIKRAKRAEARADWRP